MKKMKQKIIREVEPDGDVYYYYTDGDGDCKMHREDGPACEYADGDKFWYLHGKKHREDGPAVDLMDGTKHWLIHGKTHREDGPAMERTDGTLEWWIYGDKLTFARFIDRLDENDPNRSLLVLKYGDKI